MTELDKHRVYPSGIFGPFAESSVKLREGIDDLHELDDVAHWARQKLIAFTTQEMLLLPATNAEPSVWRITPDGVSCHVTEPSSWESLTRMQEAWDNASDRQDLPRPWLTRKIGEGGTVVADNSPSLEDLIFLETTQVGANLRDLDAHDHVQRYAAPNILPVNIRRSNKEIIKAVHQERSRLGIKVSARPRTTLLKKNLLGFLFLYLIRLEGATPKGLAAEYLLGDNDKTPDVTHKLVAKVRDMAESAERFLRESLAVYRKGAPES
ncbi:MAG: hypothetical protein GY722_29990 [bacterium]|nr:hypothetical protein [bacterium]